MKGKEAASRYRELERLRGYHALADQRELILQCLREDRVTIDPEKCEAALRLEHPLQDGRSILRARSLSVAERSFTKSFRGDAATKGVAPQEEITQMISVMNGIHVEVLEGMSESDRLVLIVLAAFLAE